MVKKQSATSWCHTVKAAFVLILIWAWLYLPFLGTGELENEEGHRAVPAQEMWDRNDWVLPTYLNEPYLKKPPGFYWAIRVVSLPFGEVSHWSLRLTSAIGTLAGALLIGRWAQSWSGRGLLVGLVYLITPEVWIKGTLGEIDGLFSVQVMASVYLFWKSIQLPKGNVWALMSGAWMAWAILTKGPIALLFFYAGFSLWLYWEGKVSRFFGLRHLLFILASVTPILLWIFFLIQRIPFDELMMVWHSEMVSQRAADGVLYELYRGMVFPFGIVLAFLPGFLKLLEIGHGNRLERTEKSIWRFGIAFSIPMFLLLVFLGRRVRYALPGGVFISLLWLIPARGPAEWFEKALTPRVMALLLIGLGGIHAGFIGLGSQENGQQKIASAINRYVDEGEILLIDLDGDYIGLPFYLNGHLDEIVSAETLPSTPTKLLGYTKFLSKYPTNRNLITTIDPLDGPSLTLIEIGGET